MTELVCICICIQTGTCIYGLFLILSFLNTDNNAKTSAILRDLTRVHTVIAY